MTDVEPIWISEADLRRSEAIKFRLLCALRMLAYGRGEKHGEEPLEPNQLISSWGELGELSGLCKGSVARYVRAWVGGDWVVDVESENTRKWRITLTPLPDQDGPQYVTATEAAFYSSYELRMLAYCRLLGEGASVQSILHATAHQPTYGRHYLGALYREVGVRDGLIFFQ